MLVERNLLRPRPAAELEALPRLANERRRPAALRVDRLRIELLRKDYDAA